MAETTEAVEEKTEEQQTQDDTKTQVQSAEFPEVADNETAGAGTNIDLLLDMDIPITVAIGRMEIPIHRIMQLSPGSVLKLDKPIDAPADLYLKDNRFATGTIVVVENKFAVRIKEILGTGAPATPG